MSDLIVPGAVPQQPPRPLWGGVYSFDAEATALGSPGRDDAESAAQRRVRESARKAGHTPVGGVKIVWADRDPDDPEAEPVEGRVWIKAAVAVIPDGEKVRVDVQQVASVADRIQAEARRRG